MRTGIASLLVVLGLVTVLIAATGAAAQSTGTCYVMDEARDCTSDITASMSCDSCLALGFPFMSWQSTTGSCLTSAEMCSPTAVTFLNVDTPITACNAAWTVPGFGLLGMVLAAGGLGILKRSHRAG